MTGAFDPQTLAFYQQAASDYVSRRPDDPEPEVIAFLDKLPSGASILELGCGGGRDARYMLSRGFELDATDGVPEMAAEAESFIGAPVRVMRFDELNVLSGYDAVIANAALLHVPLGELADTLVPVWRALKAGGWHFASYKTGGEPGYDVHGRYYNYPTEAELRRAYALAGDWLSIDITNVQGVGHFSAPSRWLMVTGQRAY